MTKDLRDRTRGPRRATETTDIWRKPCGQLRLESLRRLHVGAGAWRVMGKPLESTLAIFRRQLGVKRRPYALARSRPSLHTSSRSVRRGGRAGRWSCSARPTARSPMTRQADLIFLLRLDPARVSDRKRRVQRGEVMDAERVDGIAARTVRSPRQCRVLQRQEWRAGWPLNRGSWSATRGSRGVVAIKRRPGGAKLVDQVSAE